MKIKLLLLVLSINLIGCQSIQRYSINDNSLIWKYGDLRLLDPIDTTEPSQDLIALYTRINDKFFQIRIDFLNLDSINGQDIYIPIDTNPGGLDLIKTIDDGMFRTELFWDYLIIVPASGDVKVLDSFFSSVDEMRLIIMRDTIQDNIVISYNLNTLPMVPNLTKLQVFITPPNQKIAVDQIEPTYVDASPPSRAKVIFAFWNTFSSSTPAETLRSWAGAHSGPISSRHGLKYLIDAAAQTKSTIFLMDLLKPETLSALDYLNVLPQIRALSNKGILGLTDDINSFMSSLDARPLAVANDIKAIKFEKIWNISKTISNEGLEKIFALFLFKSDILFCNGLSEYVCGYDYAQFNTNNYNCPLSPLNQSEVYQPSDVLTNCKTIFISNALSNSFKPVVLGGDFSNSLLGDPSISSSLFAYIYNHPWIQVLSVSDLSTEIDRQIDNPPPYSVQEPGTTTEVTQTIASPSPTLFQPDAIIYSALLQAPENQISDLAWQVFSSLTQPASSDLISLRLNYIGQIGYILAAAQWAEKPTSNVNCSIDLDYDGKNECILASKNIFLTLEPEGGYMPFVFTLDERGYHQIIGPSWEFILGLSDPSVWNLSLGVRSDPDQVLGAFEDNYDIWSNYTLQLFENNIIMDSANMAIRKSFTISDDSIQVTIHDPDSLLNSTYIPLVVDPWIRFTPGWGDKYTVIKNPYAIRWGINSGEWIELISNNQILFYPFNATHKALSHPEDPNFDYSRGHYLPYPMALAEIQPSGDYSVNIIINP